mmetsp:Transcript_39199/g.124798  ORF Transcript_39199/g.124798 Transcript_39199/m.124798 type:complete len:240 (-) Transcript_39199:2054-2773(-)
MRGGGRRGGVRKEKAGSQRHMAARGLRIFRAGAPVCVSNKMNHVLASQRHVAARGLRIFRAGAHVCVSAPAHILGPAAGGRQVCDPPAPAAGPPTPRRPSRAQISYRSRPIKPGPSTEEAATRARYSRPAVAATSAAAVGAQHPAAAPPTAAAAARGRVSCAGAGPHEPGVSAAPGCEGIVHAAPTPLGGGGAPAGFLAENRAPWVASLVLKSVRVMNFASKNPAASIIAIVSLASTHP